LRLRDEVQDLERRRTTATLAGEALTRAIAPGCTSREEVEEP
jgi:hypothetical protein